MFLQPRSGSVPCSYVQIHQSRGRVGMARAIGGVDAWFRIGAFAKRYRLRCPPRRRSTRHEHRYGCVCQNVPGGAAEYHLPQSALGVGALDQQVAVLRRCVGEDRLTGAAARG